MKEVKIVLIFLSILWSCGEVEKTSTVVVQNGNNEYTGCEDSYTFAETPDENYSDDPEIMTFNCAT